MSPRQRAAITAYCLVHRIDINHVTVSRVPIKMKMSPTQASSGSKGGTTLSGCRQLLFVLSAGKKPQIGRLRDFMGKTKSGDLLCLFIYA